MKIEPFELGGLLITPENEWEECYLSNLGNELHSTDFLPANFPKEDWQPFILLSKTKRDCIM